MKEATGEVNMTLVVVSIVALLAAFFYFVIWPIVRNEYALNSSCGRAACENPCGRGSGKNVCDQALGKVVPCHVNGSDTIIYCTWKG